MGLLDGMRALQGLWELGLASSLSSVFPQLLGWAHPLGCPVPRESSGCPPRDVSLTQDPMPGDDKHLGLQGKAWRVRAEAAGLCQVLCQLRAARCQSQLMPMHAGRTNTISQNCLPLLIQLTHFSHISEGYESMKSTSSEWICLQACLCSGFWGWELLWAVPQCQVALVAVAWRWLSCPSLAAGPFD